MDTEIYTLDNPHLLGESAARPNEPRYGKLARCSALSSMSPQRCPPCRAQLSRSLSPSRPTRASPTAVSRFNFFSAFMYSKVAPPVQSFLKTCKSLASGAALAALIPLSALAQEVPQLNLQRTKLSAGMHVIDAQLAVTPEQRQIGLMMRKDMPQHEGMLFVFEQASQQCFWMKNTLLPLTAAFVADDGTVINMADMRPQTTDSYCSEQPVRYVLEMNQGWFVKKGIKAGTKLGGPVFEAKR